MDWIKIILIIALVVGIGLIVALNPPQEKDLGRDKPLTYSEYNELIEIYNHELKKLNGKIRPQKGEGVLDAFNRQILNRDVKKTEKMLRLHNKNYNAKDYEERREYLIKKSQ